MRNPENSRNIVRMSSMTPAESTRGTVKPPLDLDQLRACRQSSLKIREELDKLLSTEIGKYTTEDTSLVVFGSLARGEWTSKRVLVFGLLDNPLDFVLFRANPMS